MPLCVIAAFGVHFSLLHAGYVCVPFKWVISGQLFNACFNVRCQVISLIAISLKYAHNSGQPPSLESEWCGVWLPDPVLKWVPVCMWVRVTFVFITRCSSNTSSNISSSNSNSVLMHKLISHVACCCTTATYTKPMGKLLMQHQQQQQHPTANGNCIVWGSFVCAADWSFKPKDAACQFVVVGVGICLAFSVVVQLRGAFWRWQTNTCTHRIIKIRNSKSPNRLPNRGKALVVWLLGWWELSRRVAKIIIITIMAVCFGI